MLRWLTAATLCLLLPLLGTSAFAQDGAIEGTVTDARTGELLPGASVLIQETQAGAAADVDGEFRIDGIEPGRYTVVASFVGYQRRTQSVEVGAGEVVTVNIQLRADVRGLDELVVTGYAVQPRREVTGAITSIDGAEFQARSIQSPQQALQGRSAGVQMAHTSGQPGGGAYVRIRGVASIDGGNDPLWIIDGIPQTNESFTTGWMSDAHPLEGINPSDIESIEVLRDAEATAIYGAQGANGVILVTTRSGMNAPTQFQVRTQYGYSEQARFFDTMDAPTWVSFFGEAWANHARDQGNDPEAARQAAYANFGHPNEVETYDWQRVLHRAGHQYRADVTAQGGTDNTRFYLSGNYRNQQGTTFGSAFERYGFRSNVDHQASDRLTIEARIGLSQNAREGTLIDGNFIASPFHGGVSVRPTTPIYDSNDPTGYNQNIPGVIYNVLQVAKEEEMGSRSNEAIGSVAGMYQLTSALNLRTNIGITYRTIRDRRFRPPSVPRYASGLHEMGSVMESTREVWNTNTNLVLNYNQSFDEVHNVRGLVGFEYRRMWRERHYLYAEGLPNEFFSTLNMTSIASSWGGAQSEYRTQGLFSRLQYNFNQRYYASLNVRYDGHSRFGEERRYGLFYSGSLAWDISQEPFMNGVDWVGQLKPRISYGITGNSDIGNFSHMTLYGAGGSYGGSPGLRPTNLGNAQLTWEQTRMTDVAVDFSLLQARVYGSVGVYRNDTEYLLLDRFLPLDSGFDGVTDNVGTVRNEGIEIELGVVPVDIGRFMWRTDFNITFQDSEILDLGTNPDGSIRQTVSSSVRLGEKRHIWWGREYVGVNPADGRPMYLDQNGELTYVASSSDYRNIGSYIPDYFGGWNNTLSYGPLQVNALFQFEIGSDVNNVTYQPFLLDPGRQRALSNEMLERWQEPGDITHIPMAYRTSGIRGGTPHTFWSSFRIDDASYIRLKNLTVTYQLPTALTQLGQLRGASIFVQGENLITWDEYRGPDPEIVSQQSGSYPQARQFTVGIEIGF